MKKYWDNYYKFSKSPIKPTKFSIFCKKYLKSFKGILYDVGCGNGRDTIYFNRLKIEYNVDLNDLSKIETKLKKHNIDTAIHLAGESTIDSINNKKNYFLNNVKATNNLIKFLKKLNIHKIIFSSTAAVYKENIKVLSEKSKVGPKNIYGKTKLICENVIKKEFTKKKKSYVIFRFFNVCGSLFEKKVGEIHNPETHLIPILVHKVLNNDIFKIYGNNYKTLDGTCVRDYIHVKDLCVAHQRVIQLNENTDLRHVINLGTNKGLSILEIIKKINQIIKINKVKYFFSKKRKGDLSKLVCTGAKAAKILDWKPSNSNLKNILTDEIKWQKYLLKKNIQIKTIY